MVEGSGRGAARFSDMSLLINGDEIPPHHLHPKQEGLGRLTLEVKAIGDHLYEILELAAVLRQSRLVVLY